MAYLIILSRSNQRSSNDEDVSLDLYYTCWIDGVRDDANHGFGTLGGAGVDEIADDRGVDVKQIVTSHSRLSGNAFIRGDIEEGEKHFLMTAINDIMQPTGTYKSYVARTPVAFLYRKTCWTCLHLKSCAISFMLLFCDRWLPFNTPRKCSARGACVR